MSAKTFEEVLIEIDQATAQAARVAGRYAMEFYRDNIRQRSGYPQGGAIQKWKPRAYATRRQKGKKILQVSGRLRDAIRLISYDRTHARIGVDNPDVLPYARAHQDGAEITVTRKMKGYFWAQYYKANGIKKGAARPGRKPRAKSTPDGDFYKAMALKKAGSSIKIPARPFVHTGPDIERGITRELEAMFNQINK